MRTESILTFIIAVIIISGALSLFITGRKRKAMLVFSRDDLEQATFTRGVEIPLLEAYSGLKALAPIKFAGNNLNPKTTFFSDHFEYQVIFKKRAAYSDIASLRSFRSRFYNKIRFTFHNRNLFFTAVFTNEDTLQGVLAFLAERGIRPDERSRT